MYKIGELSRICHIPVKTLRYYDREGLLIPDEVDSFTGYRYYSTARIADCNRIISLKKLGFSLAEIKEHLHAGSDEDILALVDSKRAELVEKSKEISLQLKQLDHIRESLSEGEGTIFHMVVKSCDSIRVAFLRKIYETKAEAEATIEHMKAVLLNQLLSPRTVIINYEIEYREKELDLGACVEIVGNPPDSCKYEEKILSFPGELATIVCKRELLDEGYRAILSQIHAIDYQINGASYEIYYEDDTVEIRIPVCKKIKCIDPPIEKQAFENDEEAVGKWEIIDIVSNKEQFFYGHPKCPEAKNSVWSELYFPEGGAAYWFLKGWTKGYLYLEATIPDSHIVAMPYTIEKSNGRTIMFLEIPRRYNDGSRDSAPLLLVFEKASNQSPLSYKTD